MEKVENRNRLLSFLLERHLLRAGSLSSLVFLHGHVIDGLLFATSLINKLGLEVFLIDSLIRLVTSINLEK